MTAKEILIEQMESCYNKKSWFVPFTNVLAGLTGEQVETKGANANNSIKEIIAHLIFWNERWLNRFKGLDIPKMEGNNNSTFVADSNWEEMQQKFYSVLAEWLEELKNADDAKLSNEAFPGFEDSWHAVISELTIHNAYHIGQIVTLRKQYGNWDSKQGVS